MTAYIRANNRRSRQNPIYLQESSAATPLKFTTMSVNAKKNRQRLLSETQQEAMDTLDDIADFEDRCGTTLKSAFKPMNKSFRGHLNIAETKRFVDQLRKQTGQDTIQREEPELNDDKLNA